MLLLGAGSSGSAQLIEVRSKSVHRGNLVKMNVYNNIGDSVLEATV